MSRMSAAAAPDGAQIRRVRSGTARDVATIVGRPATFVGRCGPMARWGSCPVARSKSQTKSQRPQTPGHARPLPAAITAARWHVRTFPAPSSHTTDFAYERGVTVSNPVAPTRFSQLNGIFETLIGNPATTAGNHRCMLPDERKRAQRPWPHPPITGVCRVGRRHPPALVSSAK
jgi:hypothetical protein